MKLALAQNEQQSLLVTSTSSGLSASVALPASASPHRDGRGAEQSASILAVGIAEEMKRTAAGIDDDDEIMEALCCPITQVCSAHTVQNAADPCSVNSRRTLHAS